MHPGPDPLGAPPSFAARRPNASNLGTFELPPPPPHMQNMKHNYSSFNTINASQSSQAPSTIAGVGSLLTPPSNLSGDGISPVSGVTTTSSNSTQSMQYTPNGQYIYSPPAQAPSGYGYQPGSQPPQSYNNPSRGMFSPVYSNQQRHPGSHQQREGLPPPPYEVNLPPFPASGSMAAPSNLPTMSAQQQHHQAMNNAMMNAQTPVSSSAPQQSPVHAQEGFQRPPPTPTYYGSQPSTTPQQQSFPYSTGPSPTQQSPISAGGSMSRMSPANSQGQVTSLQSAPSHSPHPYSRPFGGYLPPGPVLSNVNNPNGQLALVGGMNHAMMPGFNSGHAATMQHMYGGHHPQQPQAANDRPFKCDQCPQSFNRNHDLKRHKRIHLAVKPFPCGHCDKSFSRKDALKRHILVKGCGKVSSGGDGEKNESLSPNDKGSSGAGDIADSKPAISSHS
ncbi:hypothetical protein BU16DRAFT_454332 [Lophium mytilinum]|uniref:C2H2-type domain-containing protein n=1 Tax=Lophium mytilinum TaxID=390894 RepID=A0A6A6R7U5_9PEZI|nr:hypothetical protein BU16DRAFT_454332 [Lophium mytilinum]